MATEVVNSFNIFVDSERWVGSSSTGNNIELPLGQTPITCASNQFIRLTLQSFSMYKSWTNVNPNNNKFRVSCLDTFAAGTNAPLSNELGTILASNYASFNELVQAFGDALGVIMTAYTGVVATATPATIIPLPSEEFVGTGNGVMQFVLDFATPVVFVNPVIIQFKVADGDCFELMGGNRIRDVASVTPSISCIAGVNKLTIDGYYNLQLSTQQNIYLRTGVGGSNIQTGSYNSGNTDEAGQSNLGASNVLGKISIQDEFAVFSSATQMEYFVNLNVKALTYLQLFITDSHNRAIPEYVNNVAGAQAGGTEQDTLGNRSFEACIKVDIVQFMSQGNNVLQTNPIQHNVPARFGTEPLNKQDYGESGFPTPTFGLLNIK